MKRHIFEGIICLIKSIKRKFEGMTIGALVGISNKIEGDS